MVSVLGLVSAPFVLLLPLKSQLNQPLRRALYGIGGCARRSRRGWGGAEGVGTLSSSGSCGPKNSCWFFLFTPSGVGMVPLDTFVFLLGFAACGFSFVFGVVVSIVRVGV